MAAELFKKNEMYDDNINDLADAGKVSDWKASEFNISQKTLLKILTRYDIAPATCSHIRGQEQIFGSRVTKDANNELTAFGKSEFPHPIRSVAQKLLQSSGMQSAPGRTSARSIKTPILK